MRKRRSFTERVHLYFFPQRHNGYKPHFFSAKSIATVLVLIVLLEGAYLGGIAVLTKTNFLAAVLPGTLIALTNGDRADNNAGALVEDPLLDQAAQLKANDMVANNYFAHVSPSGKTPWDWLNQVGYQYGYAGENLAVNFTDSEDVENAWMHSPAHRANIVKPEYTRIGVATAEGTYNGQPAIYVVQFFASPAGAGNPSAPAVASAAPAAPAKAAPPAATTTLSPPKAPTGDIALADVSTSSAPQNGAAASSSAVLGSETTPPASVSGATAPSFFARVISDPNHVVEYILFALLALVIGLVLISVLVKVRIQHVGVVMGGLVILVAASAALFINSRFSAHVALPSSSLDASVISAIP